MNKRMRIWREKWNVPDEICTDATFKLHRDGTPLTAWGCGARAWHRDPETGEWSLVAGLPVGRSLPRRRRDLAGRWV
jgi:hypothetical protein